MISLSYNLSENLRESLRKIEILRARILLAPIPPDTELRLRWEAFISRTYWSLVIHETSLTKSEVVKLLSNIYPSKRKLNEAEQEVLYYKNALDYISWVWLVSPRNITAKVIIDLNEISSAGILRSPESELKKPLDYLAASSEHPVIQAAIAQIALLNLNGFSRGNGRTARLTSYLFLYKFGYDFRGFLCLDEYFKRDFMSYRENIKRVLAGGNITFWLEFFAQALEHQLEKAFDDITQQKTHTDLKQSFFDLNDRQKGILSLLSEPEVVISNKKVQKMFKVSQITASRDLSKLATLGLLFTHGKGRSVYYTRV